MDPTKQYLATKLNPILEPLVTEMLSQKPNDPVEFMIAYLKKLQKPGKGRVSTTGIGKKVEHKEEEKDENRV